MLLSLGLREITIIVEPWGRFPPFVYFLDCICIEWMSEARTK